MTIAAYRLANYLAAFFLLVSSCVCNAAIAAGAEQWGVWEASLDGPQDGNPYIEVQLSATLTTGDTRISVPGFYDGNGVYKLRFCVFPKSYTYNQNELELFAFQKRADGSFDFDRPDPAFWHHTEQRILDLQRLDIQADLILWHPYDRWGFADMSDPQDDRYLRYCIARLSAYRNVWWSLANEYDFMTDRPKNHRGNKQMEDWDRFFQILQNEDPHHRMRGIHNGRIWYDHTRDWVTHASGMDRQFRGQIRGLEIFGSRISGRGALSLEEIVKR